MNTYERLLDEASNEGLIVKEKPLKYTNGRIMGRRVAIRESINTTAEKTCVLAEELGHYYTSYGRIVDMSDAANRKQERKARAHGYDKLIGLYGIITAHKANCQNVHEAAELLDVTEEYFRECIDYYREKYGTHIEVDNYVIFFIPNLAVMEKL